MTRGTAVVNKEKNEMWPGVSQVRHHWKMEVAAVAAPYHHHHGADGAAWRERWQ